MHNLKRLSFSLVLSLFLKSAIIVVKRHEFSPQAQCQCMSVIYCDLLAGLPAMVLPF